MLGVGIAAIFSTVVSAVFRIALVIAGAACLTHFVSLPEPVGTLVWIGAIGYSLLCLLGVAIVFMALVAAANADTVALQPRRRRATRRLR